MPRKIKINHTKKPVSLPKPSGSEKEVSTISYSSSSITFLDADGNIKKETNESASSTGIFSDVNSKDFFAALITKKPSSNK